MNKTRSTASQKTVVATRIKRSINALLENISKHTKIRKSALIRAAITQWLQNAPATLPLDLRIELTRANMERIVETIKNLRWTYHQARQANLHIHEMEKQQWLPPHTAETIKKLENEILKMQQQLDDYLKQQYINSQTGEPQP